MNSTDQRRTEMMTTANWLLPSMWLIVRTYDELSAFYDSGTYTQLVKKPVPMLRTVDDAVDVIDSGIMLVENPQKDIYKNGVRRGDNKFVKELLDLIPVASAIQSTQTVMSQVYGMIFISIKNSFKMTSK